MKAAAAISDPVMGCPKNAIAIAVPTNGAVAK